MANINDDITAIRSATYGADVREAIADGIENCYNITDMFNNADAAITILDAGTPKGTVSITNVGSGSNRHKRFNFGVPRGSTGAKGDKGDKGSPGTNGTNGITPNVTVGTVTTGAPGTNAVVTRSGTNANPVFNFTIPRGSDGNDASVTAFAEEYNSSSTYNVGALCTYGARLYRCTRRITSPKAWDGYDWAIAKTSRAVYGGARVTNVSSLPDANLAEANRIYVIPATGTDQTSSNYIQNLPYANAAGTLITLGWQSGTGSDAVGSMQLFMATDGILYSRYHSGTNTFTSWINYVPSTDSSLDLLEQFAEAYNPNKIYYRGRFVVYQNQFYKCNVDETPAGAWNPNYWNRMDSVLINLNNSISITRNYFAPEFSQYQDYQAGDYCWYPGDSDLGIGLCKFIQNHPAGPWNSNHVEGMKGQKAFKKLDLLADYYAPEFEETKSYRAGSIVRYNGLLYIFRNARTPGPWTASEVSPIIYDGVVYPITEWLLDTWNSFADQYDSTRTYAVGEYVCWNGPYLYRCSTAVTIPGAFNKAHWTRVAVADVIKNQNDNIEWLYGELAQSFSASASYSLGDFVIYNNRMYRFKAVHSGAWDSSHVDEVVVGSQLKNLANSIAPRYNPSSTYKIGSFVIYGTALYLCTQDIDTPEPFDSSHWVVASAVNYLVLSNGMIGPTFSDSTTYYPGQLVIYNNRLYRAVRSHQGEWDANDFVQIAVGNQLFTLANSFTSQYSPARSYKVDDYCVIAGAIYRCIEDINTPEVFNEAHWYRISALGVCDAISNFIAPKFSTAKRYGIGEFCVRNNQLYRFTSPHLEGAWNDNDVEQTNLSDTLSGVSTGVVLKSPNGTRFQLSVSNDGTLSASAVE